MLVGGGWCWFDKGQRCPLRKWLHFGDPGKSNNMWSFDFVHNLVWEPHTLAATPLSLLFSVASTTTIIGHNIFTPFVDRRKNTHFERTSMATEHVGMQFSQYLYTYGVSDCVIFRSVDRTYTGGRGRGENAPWHAHTHILLASYRVEVQQEEPQNTSPRKQAAKYNFSFCLRGSRCPTTINPYQVYKLPNTPQPPSYLYHITRTIDIVRALYFVIDAARHHTS